MAQRSIHIKGFDKVGRNLNKALINLKDNTVDGMDKAARRVHTDANTTSPRIPVDTGNLRRSRFIVDSRGEVPFGRNVSFAPRSGGKEGGGGMSAHHSSVIASMRNSAMMGSHLRTVYGYSASYAYYPHEMGGAVNSGKVINWTRTGSGAKFFETAIKRNNKTIPKIIYKHNNIKSKRTPGTKKGINYNI